MDGARQGRNCATLASSYLYKMLRTWSAVDKSGTTGTAQQLLTVLDVVKPVIVAPPADASALCSAVPAIATLTATDNDVECFNKAAVTSAEVRTDGACKYNYTLTRTWSAVDAAGNKGSAVQKLKVSGCLQCYATTSRQ